MKKKKRYGRKLLIVSIVLIIIILMFINFQELIQGFKDGANAASHSF